MSNGKQRIFLFAIGAVLVLVGFAGGYAFRGKQANPSAQDYALSNVMSDLVFISLIDRNKTEDLRGLLDVRLFDDVTHERASDGAIADADFLNARMRTLAGVARRWRDSPPPNSKAMVASTAQPWFGEWQSIYESNLKLVSAADVDCRAQNCSPNFGNHQTVEHPGTNNVPIH